MSGAKVTLEDGALLKHDEQVWTHKDRLKGYHRTNLKCGLCSGALWQSVDNPNRLIHLDLPSWERHSIMVLLIKGART